MDTSRGVCISHLSNLDHSIKTLSRRPAANPLLTVVIPSQTRKQLVPTAKAYPPGKLATA
jgi:hypothetical protein